MLQHASYDPFPEFYEFTDCPYQLIQLIRLSLYFFSQQLRNTGFDGAVDLALLGPSTNSQVSVPAVSAGQSLPRICLHASQSACLFRASLSLRILKEMDVAKADGLSGKCARG